jgi:hypothetical protein
LHAEILLDCRLAFFNATLPAQKLAVEQSPVLEIKAKKFIEGMIWLAYRHSLENLEKITAVLKTFRTSIADDEVRL